SSQNWWSVCRWELHTSCTKRAHSHTSASTLLDANHCPGSVMFLFQGKFGNIFYTGDFRYNPDVLEHPILKSVIDNECVNRLYLDNTFAAEHCKFPPREKVLQDIISLIRRYPEHHVVIGVRKLGKEEVLRAIALALKVCGDLTDEDILASVQPSNPQEDEKYEEDGRAESDRQEEKGPVFDSFVDSTVQRGATWLQVYA
ncbi:5' exonuclease Apollo-like, partial [Homalodisca vitripennis]|uniref:5' exonuclease Apollo-like n=1 Tax=Homalodisca vitripennis TaxID=197043 RepID=UPI001EEAC43D